MININDKLLDKVTESEMWLLLNIAKRLNVDRRCWPSNKTLCKDTGWHIEKLQKIKKSLVDKSLMSIDDRYDFFGKLTSNSYKVKTPWIGVFVGMDELDENAQPVGKTDMAQPVGKTEGGYVGKTDNEVLTNEVLTNTADSHESASQKHLFSSDQYQDTGLKQEKQRKQAKKAVVKSEVDPAYPYFVQKWTERYPELGFDSLSGKKIKSLISQAKAICVENRKPTDTHLLVGQFEYVLAYIKRENHFCHGKSISVLDSKYREIYFEIKHGKQKKQPVDSRRSAIDFIDDLTARG